MAGSNQPLGRANTLPPQAYTSEAFFQLEVERIFRRECLVVGHAPARPAVPGRFSHLEKALWQLADYVRERIKD